MKLSRPAAAVLLPVFVAGGLFLTGCSDTETPAPAPESARTLTDLVTPTIDHSEYSGTVYEVYLDTLDRKDIHYGSESGAVAAAQAVCTLAGQYGEDAVEPVLQSLQDVGYTRQDALDIAAAAIETC